MPPSFDALSKSLAAGSSRRSLLRGLVGAATGGAIAMAGRDALAAPPSKVGICHRDGQGRYRYQEVSWNAAPAHEAHGDAIDPDFTSDANHCGGCGITCGDGYTCQASVCVVATPPGQCWWQTPSGQYVPSELGWGYPLSYAECQAFDGCHEGGGGIEACTKWTVNANDDFTAWP
jgi:hypothetical protein